MTAHASNAAPSPVAARGWLVRRTAALAFGQAAAKGAALAGALLLVRVLPARTWEALAFLLSLYLAGASLGTLNLQQGVLFYAARVGRDQRRALALQTALLLFAA